MMINSANSEEPNFQGNSFQERGCNDQSSQNQSSEQLQAPEQSAQPLATGEAGSKRRIKVVAIAESQQQRHAFIDTINACGFELIDCIPKRVLREKDLPDKVDLWLIDSLYDQELIDIIESHQFDNVLVGFNEAPYSNESNKYAKWQRKLKRRLAETLNMPELVEKKIYDKPLRNWRYVVFLGASMGGPTAVKEFLDNISPDLPICILLAHHFSSNMVDTLPKILNRHNNWRCQVIDTTQSLQAGTCLIAPIEHQIICDSHGRIFLTEALWEGNYRPSISKLLLNTSEVYGDELIGIIFSGMGNDGSLYLEQVRKNHSYIWAQDPASCTSPNQPQAVIDSGFCQFHGTPKQLADELTSMVS